MPPSSIGSWQGPRLCTSTMRSGSSHRAHASIVGPPSRLPSAAGRLLAREAEVIGGLLEDPSTPFVVDSSAERR